MIVKRTELNKIEVIMRGPSRGLLQLQFAVLLVDDGTGKEHASEWLRSAVGPDEDVAAHIAAVNDYLKLNDKEPLSADTVDEIQKHADATWTPAVVAAYVAYKKAAAEALAKTVRVEEEPS